MREKKGYGLDQVAHYFLSDTNQSETNQADPNQSDPNESGPNPPADGHIQARVPPSRCEATESPQHQETTDMLRIACQVDQAGVQRKALVDAAGDFLLHYLGTPEVESIRGIASPDFGTADLAFAGKPRNRVILARLNTGKESDAFVITSVAYYLWVRDLLSAGQSVLNAELQTELFCFCPHFSKALCHTVAAHRRTGIAVHLFRYRLFRVEGLGEPVIHFHPVLAPRKTPADKSAAASPRSASGSRTSPDSESSPKSSAENSAGPPPSQGVQEAQEHSRFMQLRQHLDD